MYASGLMSRQTPICAVAGAAETTMAISVIAMIIVDNLAFLIGNQLYSDEVSLSATSNNIK
jgi:hypothetical protein